MNVTRRALVLALVSLAALVAIAAAFAQDEDGDKVVLTVGVPEDYDTLNPLVGVEVPDFDVWNLQYATLTDKAATDFATIPGLAESWEASNGGKTYTYTLRDGLEWSDGTPLTAEDVVFNVNRAPRGGMAQPLLDGAEPDGEGDRRPHRGDHQLRSRPQASHDGRVHRARSTSGGSSTPRRSPSSTASRPSAAGRSRSRRPSGASSGACRPIPTTGGGTARTRRSTRSCSAPSTTPTRWLPRSSRVRSTPHTTFRRTRWRTSGRRRASSSCRASRAASTSSRSTAAAAARTGSRRRRIPRCSTPRSAWRSPTRSTRRRSSTACWSGSARSAPPSARRRTRSGSPRFPPGTQVAFDLAQAKKILDDAGYKDTNGDGVREMPGGGRPLDLRYMVRTESQTDGPVSEFVSGWLKEIGIGTTLDAGQRAPS